MEIPLLSIIGCSGRRSDLPLSTESPPVLASLTQWHGGTTRIHHRWAYDIREPLKVRYMGDASSSKPLPVIINTCIQLHITRNLTVNPTQCCNTCLLLQAFWLQLKVLRHPPPHHIFQYTMLTAVTQGSRRECCSRNEESVKSKQ